MKKFKIIHARTKFLINRSQKEFLEKSEELFNAKFEFERQDQTSSLTYYGGECLGIRFLIEVNENNNEYFFTAMTSNEYIDHPYEVVDLSFHFEKLLSTIEGIEFIPAED